MSRLSKSQDRLRSLADQTPAMVWTCGSDSQFDFFNQQWLDFTGRSLEQELGHGWTRGIYPAYSPHFFDVFLLGFTARESFTAEFRLRRFDGEYRWILCKGAPRYEKRKFVGFVGSCVDITDIRGAEDRRVTAAELKFATLVRATNDAIWEQDLETGRTWCNDQFYTTFGYPAGTEISHQFWVDAVHPDDLKRMTDAGDLNFDIKRPVWTVEYRFRRGDGTYAYVIDHAVVLYNERDKPVRMTGGMRDVSAEREALAALKASEARYRALIENASDAIYVTDEAGNFLEANRKTLEMLGYAAEEQLKLNVRDVIPQDDMSVLETALDAVVAGKTMLVEHAYLRKDGPVVLAENKVKLIAPGTIQVIARDMTDRNRAQRALRESEYRHRTLVETATEGIWLGDRDENTTFVNGRLAEMLGYTAAELVGKPAVAFILPDDLPLIERNLRDDPDFRAGGCDLRFIRKDGSQIWAQVSSRSLYNENGEQTGWLAMLSDVTERKLAEDRLKATAERLETILRGAPIGIGIVDSEGRLVETNTALEIMLGFSAQELIGTRITDYTHPEDLGRCIDLAAQMMSGRLDRYELEKRYIRKNGTELWVHVIVSSLKTASGIGAIGLVEDITERKRALDELQRSEARLRTFVESNVIGITFAADDGSIHYANQAFLDMTGYTRTELAKGVNWREITPPEYEVLDDNSVREMSETGSFRAYEKQLVKKDGKRVAVLIGGARYEEDKAIAFLIDLTERKQARREMTRLARIVESTDEAIISVSREGRILTWNQGAEKLYGYKADEIVGQDESIIIPGARDKEYELARGARSKGVDINRFETIRLTKSHEPKPVSITVSPLRDEAGEIIGWSKIAHDLTQAKRAEQLEEQFRQAQKLEAVGRLAGGVAHDFNNLLMVISSYTEMMQDRLEPDHRLRRNTREVLKATEKAAALTQQLLAFSRKQVLLPQIVDLNTIVEDTTKMAKRLIGEDIEMSFLPGQGLWAVQVDPGQITQILLNLCVNARDAMPMGGRLAIETRNVVIDSASAAKQGPSFSPGSYAMLVVSDNGEGMTEEVKDRVFEPFFTTKGSKGTGLGLATVYGIVKQSGGYIWVHSAPGEGSRFDLYFPRVDQPLTQSAPVLELHGKGNGETILVVEDEDSLRASVCEYLKEHGYAVLQAQDGDQALDISDGHSGPIHVLLTDVIMPKMSGGELAKRLSDRQEMITIYMSGYTDDAILNHGILQSGAEFIHKPFALSALARKLREALVRRAVEKIEDTQDRFRFLQTDN